MKKILLPLLALATLSITSVYADDYKGQPYVSAQVGVGAMDIPSSSNGFAYRIAGGYDFTINEKLRIAPEIGYTGYPDYSQDYTYYVTSTGGAIVSSYNVNSSIKGHNVDALINLRYAIEKNISLIAKGGFAYTTQSGSSSGPAIVDGSPISYATANNSKILPEIGLGVGYDLNKKIGFNFTYNHVFGDDVTAATSDSAVASVNTFLLGMTYTF